MKKLQIGEIPDHVMDYVIEESKRISNGEIVFIAQDGRLMGVEINSRRRLAEWTTDMPTLTYEVCENLKKTLVKEFRQLTYGRLQIKIQKGKIYQIERTVQHRFSGLDGEGI